LTVILSFEIVNNAERLNSVELRTHHGWMTPNQQLRPFYTKPPPQRIEGLEGVGHSYSYLPREFVKM
jgi:hypothetical protein